MTAFSGMHSTIIFDDGRSSAVDQSPRQQMIVDDNTRTPAENTPSVYRESRPSRDSELEALRPFGFGNAVFGDVMGQMEFMMDQFERMQQQIFGGNDSVGEYFFGRDPFFRNDSFVSDPNSHVFSESKTIFYDNRDENFAPRLYEESHSVRRSGDIKEERKTLRDSATGTEKMTIGHHMGDRSHIIEKTRDPDTGRILTNQNFRNLNENEAEAFDRRWSQATEEISKGFGGIFGRLFGSKQQPRSFLEAEKSSVPIVEEPPDEGGPCAGCSSKCDNCPKSGRNRDGNFSKKSDESNWFGGSQTDTKGKYFDA